MTRLAPLLMMLLIAMLGSPAALAAIRYYAVTGTTSASSNGCPIWVVTDNSDDCSYSDSNPGGLATDDWVGPVFGAGFYAPGQAPLVFTQGPVLGPVTAPAPVLALGGKTGIPVTRGFIRINDNSTPDLFTDDDITGTLEYGPFQRNIAISPGERVIESLDRLIHRLLRPAGTTGSIISGTRNPDGSIDYVVARNAAGTSADAFPAPLAGTTTAGGGFADTFPSQVASQSSEVAGDVAYWAAPGTNGIARIDGTAAASTGLVTAATVWGYNCLSGSGPCVDREINWNAPTRARYKNVLLRLTVRDETDPDGGTISAGTAILVNEYNGSAQVSLNGSTDDSSEALTVGFTGEGTLLPIAFDDRAVLDLNPENLEYFISVLANDAPGVAPAVVTIVDAPTLGTATIENNTVAYTPTDRETEGVDTLTYRITDATNATATGLLVLTLTDSVACTNDIASTAIGTPVTIPVLANDVGQDVPPIVVSLVSGLAEGTAVVNVDNTITFTPPPDLAGVFSLTYQVIDGTFEPATCTATVIAEAALALDDFYSTEDSTLIDADVIRNDVRNVLAAPIEIEITSEPANGATIPIPALGNGLAQVRYLPNPDFTGTDTFTYRLRDANGFVTNTATVTVQVIDSVPVAVDDTREPPSVFDPPDGPPLLTAENGVERLIDVASNDTIVDTPYTLLIVTPPAHGTAEFEPGGSRPSIAYTSAADYLGPDSFTYSIRDSNGDVSTPATVTISAVEDSTPTAVDDARNGDSRADTLLNVLNNDSGLVDFPVTLVISQPPTLGTARVLTAAQTQTGVPNIEYRSNAGSSGTDTLRYRITDADGDVSEPGTVTITIANGTPTAVNDPTNAGGLKTTPGQSLTVPVFSNDTGRNNFPITLAISSPPSNGKVTTRSAATDNSLPTVTYQPNTGFEGTDTFSYTFTDADGQTSNVATVAVVVEETPNQVPVSADDTARIDGRIVVSAGEDILENGAFINVLQNDTGIGDTPIRVTIVQAPDPLLGKADVVVGSNGNDQIRFASRPDASGTATLTYRLRDQDGDESSGTSTVTITIGNTIPQANFDTVGVTDQLVDNNLTYIVERLQTRLSVLNNDPSNRRTNRPLRLEIVDQPDHGTVEAQQGENENLGDLGLAYQSEIGYTGPDSFSYRIVDADGDASNEATVRFNVLSILTANGDPTGRAPTLIPFTTIRNRPLDDIDILANDGGFAYGPVVIEIVAEANGQATVNPDNTVSFVPDRDFVGAYLSPNCENVNACRGGAGFRYRLTDSRNQVAEAIVQIDVFPAAVTDEGGSSSLDALILGLLGTGVLLRARRRLH